MARTEPLRSLGGFDPEFRRCAGSSIWRSTALDGAHFIQR
jgi:hypothetical protein